MEYVSYIFGEFTSIMNVLLWIAGNIIGIVFGAIPGLSGTMAVMLFMPLTFTMSSGSAIIFLISLWTGGCSGGFVGSVLLGIPGSPSSVATCWDGYPMTKKGLAGRALSIGMLASFMGTLLSAIIGAIASQQIAKIAFALGPWEYFGLCLLAITLVIAISRGKMFKGLAAASLGLLLSSVGTSPIDAVARFTFGNFNILGGLNMTAVLMGVFAISSIIVDFSKGYEPIPKAAPSSLKGLGLKMAEIAAQKINIIRSFLIGLWIGFLPGMGAGLSNVVAYSAARNASKTPEQFGKGIDDGIWAPEVANNAAIGGALIPMTSLGIPGDTATALLIGAMTVHGLELGPMSFVNSGDVIYLMYAAVALSAILVLFLQLFFKRYLPYVLRVPNHYMQPALLIICLISAYVSSNNMANVWLMILFAVVGIIMIIGKLPESPLLLAFILGPTIEKNMLKAFQYTGTVSTFFTRPVSAIFMIFAILSIFAPVLRFLYAKIRPQAKA